MKICAIVLHYGSIHDTRACLKSLHGQVDRFVIVDNQGDFPRKPAGKILLRPERNLGFAAGVNRAIEHAGLDEYDAFILANNDTIAAPGCVSLLQPFLHGNVGMVAPIAYSHPSGKRWSYVMHFSPHTGLQFHSKPIFPTIKYYPFCFVLIHASTFRRIGMLDERFFCYGEDIEYCHRMTRHGIEFREIPYARVYHKQTGPSGNKSEWFELQMVRMRRLLLELCTESRMQVKAYMPLVWFFLFLVATKKSIKYRHLNAFRGMMRGFCELKNTV